MYLQDIYAKLQNHTATTARTLPSFPSCSCSFSLLLLANARIVLVWFWILAPPGTGLIAHRGH